LSAGREDYLSQADCCFEIPKSGVYSLEGDNQSGKSTLVRLVMGALPSHLNESFKTRILLNGREIVIGSIHEAHQHGLAAVFQDDTLIPTVTVAGQYKLRHAAPFWLRISKEGPGLFGKASYRAGREPA